MARRHACQTPALRARGAGAFSATLGGARYDGNSVVEAAVLVDLSLHPHALAAPLGVLLTRLMLVGAV